jgi:hypothetical protein
VDGAELARLMAFFEFLVDFRQAILVRKQTGFRANFDIDILDRRRTVPLNRTVLEAISRQPCRTEFVFDIRIEPARPLSEDSQPDQESDRHRFPFLSLEALFGNIPVEKGYGSCYHRLTSGVQQDNNEPHIFPYRSGKKEESA